MKISAQEELGLRILLRIAQKEGGMTIAEIADLEGISHHNTAKLCRMLRIYGYIESTKGHTGGYSLAKRAEDINLGELLKKLGGSLYDGSFCDRFSGTHDICTHHIDCTVRSVWKVLQHSIDEVLRDLTLKTLLKTEKEASQVLHS